MSTSSTEVVVIHYVSKARRSTRCLSLDLSSGIIDREACIGIQECKSPD